MNPRPISCSDIDYTCSLQYVVSWILISQDDFYWSYPFYFLCLPPAILCGGSGGMNVALFIKQSV